MATEDGGEDVQQAERGGLKRKLTGPPRLLLLGKTRTRSAGEDRPETRNNPNRTDGDGAAAESDEPTEAPDMEEEGTSESCRGRCEVTGDITNRKLNRRRWWRRFSPAVVCFTKQTKVEKSSAKRRSERSPPEEAPQENDDAALPNNTKAKKTAFKRFLTSSDAQRTPEQKQDGKPSLSFRKRLQMFLSRRRTRRSSPANMEDMKTSEEAPPSSAAQVDEPTDLHGDVTDRSPEVVTVTAEMNVQPSEEMTSPDETPKEERRVADAAEEEVTDDAEIEVAANTNEVDEVFCDTADVEVVSDLDDHLSCEEASEVPAETGEEPTTNGPAVLLNSSIRIELVPPDDITEEEEEEEEWEGNQNHLLFLLGFHHSERQLLQTARSVVRAAMNAAVDQLSREQLSVSDGVHREPQGCRDHA